MHRSSASSLSMRSDPRPDQEERSQWPLPLPPPISSKFSVRLALASLRASPGGCPSEPGSFRCASKPGSNSTRIFLPSYSSRLSVHSSARPQSAQHPHSALRFFPLPLNTPFNPLLSSLSSITVPFHTPPPHLIHSHVLSWYPRRRPGNKAVEPAPALRRPRCCRKYCHANRQRQRSPQRVHRLVTHARLFGPVGEERVLTRSSSLWTLCSALFLAFTASGTRWRPIQLWQGLRPCHRYRPGK